MRRLDELGEYEAREELTADLLRHRVAVLQRLITEQRAAALLLREVREVRIRQRVADNEAAIRFLLDGIEDEDVGVHEAREQRSARPQHTETLTPDGPQFRTEQVRHRVKHFFF